ncbi:MAG TPA: DUF4336 domain-containing protein [Polyangiaceae bacterium]
MAVRLAEACGYLQAHEAEAVFGRAEEVYARRVTVPNLFEVVVPDSIWVTERAVWFGGVRLRSRTTVVRLAGDALWVHSPGAPTDEVCAGLDALGEVRWIVVPNRFHHLGAPATAARYPKAVVVGRKSAEERNPHVSVSLQTDDAAYVEATPELASIDLKGVPFLDETMFFHAATGSLIAADLLISACARDHWTWRFAARIWGRYEKAGTPPDVRWSTRASAAAAESIARLRALPLQRILVAHTDPITEQPAQTLADAWDFAVPSGLAQSSAAI